jgi:hypothetical protein
MSIDILGVVFLLALLSAPVALQYYLNRLPVAPACPTCRATTRVMREWMLPGWVPVLAATSRSECGQCGWRGRMRWQWAARTALRQPK